MSEAHGAVGEGVTRRRLIRAAASGSGTTTVGPTFVESVDGRREATTLTAVTTAATTLERDDLTGLLLYLAADERGVDIETDERGRRLADDAGGRRYEALVVDNTESGTRTATVDLLVDAPAVPDAGSLFVVTRQRRDGDDARLTLERVGTERVEQPERARANLAPTTRTATRGAPATGSDARDAVAAVAGIGAGLVGFGAALYALGRRSGNR
ncbi:hypothetical protein [Haloprofundus halobius]|uniref:hypothetical protein n=1 Tax=Haloprofundus halobius TaxID=2876194 RepID=UPI001CCB76F3|nr:hypothetical protein [Haloprofundus halobius]